MLRIDHFSGSALGVCRLTVPGCGVLLFQNLGLKLSRLPYSTPAFQRSEGLHLDTCRNSVAGLWKCMCKNFS